MLPPERATRFAPPTSIETPSLLSVSLIMATFRLLGLFGFACLFTLGSFVSAQPAKAPTEAEKVSYYKQIRPIFQAHCQGCHQPAKSRGEYIMTSFDKLMSGGTSGKKAIVPGQAAKSHLVEM